MKRPWLFLWILLLLCQILTAWLTRGGGGVPPPVVAAERRELLELAGATLREWERSAFIPASRGLRKGRIAGPNDLFEREEGLLRLRDLEARLRKTGAEVSVAADFVSWQESQGGTTRIEIEGDRGLSYLSGVIGWLEAFLEGEGGVQLERAHLHPGTRNAYPSLSFELSGGAERLGEGLLRQLEASPDWVLKELDLNRLARRGDWWLRGSSEYASKAGGL